MKIELQPVNLTEAIEFVRQHHRHHTPPVSGLFAVACRNDTQIVGVAIIGRPVSRMLQDGYTAEVTRLCTTGEQNACSILYGAAWRAARALGYRRLVTYILASESGTSLKASGWKEIGKAGGGSWSRPSRLRVDPNPTQEKIRWERTQKI